MPSPPQRTGTLGSKGAENVARHRRKTSRVSRQEIVSLTEEPSLADKSARSHAGGQRMASDSTAERGPRRTGHARGLHALIDPREPCRHTEANMEELQRLPNDGNGTAKVPLERQTLVNVGEANGSWLLHLCGGHWTSCSGHRASSNLKSSKTGRLQHYR